MSDPPTVGCAAADPDVSDFFGASDSPFAPPDLRSSAGISHVSHRLSDPSPGAPSGARCFTIPSARL